MPKIFAKLDKLPEREVAKRLANLGVATGIKTATVQARTLVTIDCPESKFTGNVEISGNALVKQILTYQGGLNNNGSSSGATINGQITHTGGDLISNGIVVHKHKHPDAQGGEVGEPI